MQTWHKIKVWDKVGNSKSLGDLAVKFRHSDDYGNPDISVSNKWSIWELGKEMKFIGKLTEKHKAIDIGIVVNPYDIVDRIKLGRYDFVYPK